MKFRVLSMIAIALFASACKKSGGEHCWQVMDALGNDMYQVCGKTESEMKDDFPMACSYYRLGPNFCWYIDGHLFLKDKPEDYVNRLKQCFGYTSAVKVSCDYCQRWYNREKHLYKPTGSFHYSMVRVQQLCGDTVQTLFQGREIILRESTDSLITLQFSNNGIF